VKKSERHILTEALLHLDQLSEYAERDLKDQAIRDAIALRLSSALDALAGLPSKTLLNLFGDNWNAMRSTRNRIVHGYLSVDHEIIEAVVREDIPPLMGTLRNRLENITSENQKSKRIDSRPTNSPIKRTNSRSAHHIALDAPDSNTGALHPRQLRQPSPETGAQQSGKSRRQRDNHDSGHGRRRRHIK